MKLRSVQALRALAAVAVLVCHLHSIEATKALGTPLLSDFWITGAAGVDLFFVISGFIMVWVAADLGQGRSSAARFLFARAARIYPLWWLFAGLMAAYFFVTYGHPWDPNRIGADPQTGYVHLLKSLFLLPQNEHPVLGVGWTLVHEMYFYIVFACLVWMVPARYRLSALSLWGAVIAIGALVGFSGPMATTLTGLVFHPMSLEFLLGGWVAYAVRAGIGQNLAQYTAILGAGSLIIIFVLFDFRTGGWLLSPFHFENVNAFTLSWGRTLCFGIPAALLLHGLVSLEKAGQFGQSIPDIFVRIGDWSYALYLSHVLVLSAIGRLYFSYVANIENTGWDNVLFLLIAATAAIVFSWWTYMLVEKPIIIWYQAARDRLFAPQERKDAPGGQ